MAYELWHISYGKVVMARRGSASRASSSASRRFISASVSTARAFSSDAVDLCSPTASSSAAFLFSLMASRTCHAVLIGARCLYARGIFAHSGVHGGAVSYKLRKHAFLFYRRAVVRAPRVCLFSLIESRSCARWLLADGRVI